MVPEAGLEPARTKVRGILSPLCLPIPPLRHAIFGGGTRIRTGDKGFADLCLTTWLCRLKYIWSGKRDSNPRHQPWQGCALPTELFPRLASQ